MRMNNVEYSDTIRALIDREAWLMSEAAGYDLTTTALGLCLINQRVTDLVRAGFSQWMADQSQNNQK